MNSKKILNALIQEILLKEFSLIDMMYTADRKSDSDRSNREPIIKAQKLALSDSDNEEIASHLIDEPENMENLGPVPPSNNSPYYMVQDPYANDSSVLPRKTPSTRG